jgi:UrcA family protein
MKTFTPANIISAATLSLALSFSAVASAETTSAEFVNDAAVKVQSVSVTYARAELSTEDGRAELYSKLRQAARQVCGPSGLREAGSLNIASRNRKCYEDALAASLSQVGTGQIAKTGF